MDDRLAYVTGVADQIAAAAAQDNKAGIQEILAKVAQENPAVAEEFARGVVDHGLRGMVERG